MGITPINLLAILLQVLLVALKLTGTIDWTWLWVWSPTWLLISFVVFCVAIYKGAIWLERKLETPGEKAARELRSLANQLRRRH